MHFSVSERNQIQTLQLYTVNALFFCAGQRGAGSVGSIQSYPSQHHLRSMYQLQSWSRRSELPYHSNLLGVETVLAGVFVLTSTNLHTARRLDALIVPSDDFACMEMQGPRLVT